MAWHYPLDSSQPLVNCYSATYNTEDFSDTVLRCIDLHSGLEVAEIFVHAALLLPSVVLRRHLRRAPVRTKDQKRVLTINLDFKNQFRIKTVRAFFKFFYYPDLDNTLNADQLRYIDTNFIAMHYLAHCYGYEKFEQFCVRRVVHVLDEDTVHPILDYCRAPAPRNEGSDAMDLDDATPIQSQFVEDHLHWLFATCVTWLRTCSNDAPMRDRTLRELAARVENFPVYDIATPECHLSDTGEFSLRITHRQCRTCFDTTAAHWDRVARRHRILRSSCITKIGAGWVLTIDRDADTNEYDLLLAHLSLGSPPFRVNAHVVEFNRSPEWNTRVHTTTPAATVTASCQPTKILSGKLGAPSDQYVGQCNVCETSGPVDVFVVHLACSTD